MSAQDKNEKMNLKKKYENNGYILIRITIWKMFMVDVNDLGWFRACRHLKILRKAWKRKG